MSVCLAYETKTIEISVFYFPYRGSEWWGDGEKHSWEQKVLK